MPLAAKFIAEHLAAHDLAPPQIARYWLHQANQKHERADRRSACSAATRRASEAPIILDEYGNTASAGSLIAFSHHNEDLAAGHATA